MEVKRDKMGHQILNNFWKIKRKAWEKYMKRQLVARNKRFGIVVSRFNEFISGKLLEGALDCLFRHQARKEDVHVAWVPGAFEIPLVAKNGPKQEIMML